MVRGGPRIDPPSGAVPGPGGPSGRPTSYHRRPPMSIARLFGARTAREGAYLLSGLPLGVAWLSILATGWLTAVGLTPTLVGLPLLLVMAYITHALAGVERA